MDKKILEVDSVSTYYHANNLVLDSISFSINKGEILGLLGRNGGGKTTMIKIITSNLSSYSGNVSLLNMNIKDKKRLVFFKANIAYLPDKEFLYPSMSGRDCIEFFSNFFIDFSQKKAYDIFNRLDINPNQKIATMSKGQVEKVGIALILSRETSLYIFDEPLAGADVISRDEIFNIIGEYSCNGATLIATHLISSVERILTNVLFLNKKSMAYGKKEEVLYSFNNLEDSFRYYALDNVVKPLKIKEAVMD